MNLSELLPESPTMTDFAYFCRMQVTAQEIAKIVEGVVVEHGSVIAMGVFISQSTRIYDRETGEIHYGRVPAGSVIVPGSLPSADGKYSLSCAVIVKRVDAKTRAKTGLNELLRPD